VIIVNAEEIKAAKAEIVRKYGEWGAYNIYLGQGVHTMDRTDFYDPRLRRICQIIYDIAAKPIDQLRILDLACLEGIYSIELARRGAQVLGLEGREANVQKALFAKEVLGLINVEFVQDDVRNLSKEKYGTFDIVLCMGIQYHLDSPDVFDFMEKVAEVCSGFAIVDTHISYTNEVTQTYKSHTYAGRWFAEHDPSTTPEERLKINWASLDNVKSFWFTRPSLYNLLKHIGFTSVYECHNPLWSADAIDRVTLLAMKGHPAEFLSSPFLNEKPEEDWPEIPSIAESSRRRAGIISRILKKLKF
jgi:2-polyprenyl-3-methyl-5-hydroxy-6-metoxy-1,4-benzoquinol methylase